MTPRYAVEIVVAERETREARASAPEARADPALNDGERSAARFTWVLVSTFTDPRDASVLYRALLEQGERARWRELRE